MQIVRNDAEVLVLQSGCTGTKALHRIQIAAVVLTGAIVAAAVCLACTSAWWPRAGDWTGAAILGALVAGILGLSYVVCHSMPLGSCFAFDRHAREILFVRQTLLRTSREEFNFDQIRGVVIEAIHLKHGVVHVVALELAEGRKLHVAGPPLMASSESHLYEIAAVMREALGISQPAGGPKKALEGWPARIMRLVLGCCLLGLSALLAHCASELWQAPSWPQVEGLVESVELGKKMSGGKHPHLTDAIEIVYRYQLGDTIYHGRSFNLQSNWLTPDEVPRVRKLYTPGGKCLVTYKPSNPARCFVELHPELSNLVGIGIMAAVPGLSGLVLVIYSLWQIARPKATRKELDANACPAGLTVPA